MSLSASVLWIIPPDKTGPGCITMENRFRYLNQFISLPQVNGPQPLEDVSRELLLKAEEGDSISLRAAEIGDYIDNGFYDILLCVEFKAV